MTEGYGFGRLTGSVGGNVWRNRTHYLFIKRRTVFMSIYKLDEKENEELDNKKNKKRRRSENSKTTTTTKHPTTRIQGSLFASDIKTGMLL